MMTLWYRFVSILPFDWAQPGHYFFMKHALLAILLISPLFSTLSTMVVAKRMSFFSDALGHSAFTGIAIGLLAGWVKPIEFAVLFSILFSIGITIITQKTRQSKDTIIGVFASIGVSLGIFLISWGGKSLSRLNQYLIGDILSITPTDLMILFWILIVIIIVWWFLYNPLLVMSINEDYAISRSYHPIWTELLFSTLLAVTVAVTISWIGLLLINSLLVLPAATARNLASHSRQYHRWAFATSLIASVSGLMISYAIGSSTGATVVLIQGILFLISFWFRKR